MAEYNNLFTSYDGLTISAACALIRVARCTIPTPALFLDRDGVIIEEKHYLCTPDDVKLINGVEVAISAARDLGWMVVIVTNQAGIGRGYYSYEDYLRVEERIRIDLAHLGVATDAVFACPYHPEGKGEFRRTHPWRKPSPGMILAAAHALNIDLSRSFMVGDRASDLQAAASAGIFAGALVQTGYGREEINRICTICPDSFTIQIISSIIQLNKIIGADIDRT